MPRRSLHHPRHRDGHDTLALRAHRPALATASALALAAAGNALGAWQATGGGDGASQAASMPAGPQPAAAAVLRDVTVAWSASSLPGGTPVEGYVVKRYDDATGTEQTVLADCAGVVTALACTERGVPAGTWRYAIVPAQGAWRGSESPRSVPVLVL